MSKEKVFSLMDAHQEFAKRTNHRVWELLEKPARTAEEEEELVITANASLYHWTQAGGAVESQRGTGCFPVFMLFLAESRTHWTKH